MVNVISRDSIDDSHKRKLYSRAIAFGLTPTYRMSTVISALRMNSASTIDFPRENGAGP